MTDFQFDLVFALPDRALDQAALLDALFEAGFDDAVIGLGAKGTLALSMDRSGEDGETVMLDAISAALAALPAGTTFREARPDLVSLADVAAQIGVTRQALQKRPMPAPSLGGLYRASEVQAQLAKARDGKIAERMEAARGWFAAALPAQKINAMIALGRPPWINRSAG